MVWVPCSEWVDWAVAVPCKTNIANAFPSVKYGLTFNLGTTRLGMSTDKRQWEVRDIGSATAVKVRRITDVPAPRLGLRIKRAREADPRPLSEICQLAGMTRSNWYLIEQGQIKYLPVETLRRIESVLGVDFGIDI